MDIKNILNKYTLDDNVKIKVFIDGKQGQNEVDLSNNDLYTGTIKYITAYYKEKNRTQLEIDKAIDNMEYVLETAKLASKYSTQYQEELLEKYGFMPKKPKRLNLTP
jgi:hypothetical protein